MSIPTEIAEQINAAFSEGGLHLNQYINFSRHKTVPPAVKYMRVLVLMKMLKEAKELIQSKITREGEFNSKEMEMLQNFVQENIQMMTVTKEFDSLEEFEKEFKKLGEKKDDGR